MIFLTCCNGYHGVAQLRDYSEEEAIVLAESIEHCDGYAVVATDYTGSILPREPEVLDRTDPGYWLDNF